MQDQETPSSAPTLTLREVTEAEIALGVRPSPTGYLPRQVVAAGEHSIQYDVKSSIPWGPNLHEVTISGPRSRALNRYFRERLVFFESAPYYAKLELCVFLEWLNDWRRGDLSLHVADLSRGRITRSQRVRPCGFVGWRGGASCEFIIQQWTSDRRSQWFAYDTRTGCWPFSRMKKRPLFRGGSEAHVLAGGKEMLIVNSHPEPFVALISLEDGALLDRRTADDFEPFLHNPRSLGTVNFDAAQARLMVKLYPPKIDHENKHAHFEKLVMVEMIQRHDKREPA